MIARIDELVATADNHIAAMSPLDRALHWRETAILFVFGNLALSTNHQHELAAVTRAYDERRGVWRGDLSYLANQDYALVVDSAGIHDRCKCACPTCVERHACVAMADALKAGGQVPVKRIARQGDCHV